MMEWWWWIAVARVAVYAFALLTSSDETEDPEERDRAFQAMG